MFKKRIFDFSSFLSLLQFASVLECISTYSIMIYDVFYVFLPKWRDLETAALLQIFCTNVPWVPDCTKKARLCQAIVKTVAGRQDVAGMLAAECR